MIEWLLELKDNVDRHGIRWGLVLTLYAIFRKERRNCRLDQRDEAIFHNLKIIMQELGRGNEWQSYSPENGLRHIYPKLLKYSMKPKEKRKKTMNSQNVNYATLIPTILGAAKLILQTFGIDIPDATVNEVVNGAAAVGTIIGIFLSHRQPIKSATPVQSDPNTFIQG